MSKLAERTGRDLNGWIEFLKINGPKDEPSQREWLKTKFGLGTNYAGWIAERAAGRGWEDDDPDEYLRVAPQYVEKMYAGGKADLRPIHDKIVALARKLGPEVKLCPCQTMVPLYRNHVFAQIKPATQKRIDLGFALGDLPPTGRLVDTGGFAKKDRITHRIPTSNRSTTSTRRWRDGCGRRTRGMGEAAGLWAARPDTGSKD